MKKLTSTFVLSTAAIVTNSLTVSAATAIDVPPAARSMAEAIRDEAKNLVAHKNYLTETSNYLKEVDGTIAQLEAQLEPARQRYDEAQTEKNKIQLSNEQIAEQKELALKRFEEALAEVERMENLLASAENSVLSAEGAAQSSERVWERTSRPENRRAFENAQDNLQRVSNNRDNIAIANERAHIKLAEAQENLDKYTGMESDLHDSQYIFEDAKLVLENLEHDLAYLREQRGLVANSLTEARKPVDLSVRNWQYVMTDIEYYSWKDNNKNRGHQLYIPLSYGLVDGPWSYGVSTGYIISNNKSRPNGSISTLDDTTLAVGYTKQYKKFDVLYTLSVNVPTGKATMYGSDAIMPDDLVKHSRFGEGWGVTPGAVISWKPTETDTWRVGTSYSFNRKYHYDSSIDDGWINPANGWDSFVRYEHAGEKNQFIAELLFTNYTRTRDNGVNYTQGRQIQPHFVYNRVLSKSQDLMFYYWYSHEGAPKSPDPSVASGTSRKGHFIGTMWSKKIDAKNTFHLTADYMKRTGSSYDSLTNLYSSDRKRFAFGFGYDYALTESSKIRFHLERFSMKDRDSGVMNSKYKGYNAFIGFYIYW